ncbi:MAG: hypothetical protein QM722_09100 [Piscinibacter sp.]
MTLLRTTLTLLAALAPALSLRAGAAEDELVQLQHDWEVIRYQTPNAEREKRFEALAARAHRFAEAQPARAEPLVWEGIIISSWAGEKHGLGALSLVRRAKALYESAIRIDGRALDGLAYHSLGMLYAKAPGWPLGFGDKARAKALLEQALALDPNGIDPNFCYGEFLLDNGHANEATIYLEHALQAPLRPGRHVADTGRREEARVLLDRARAER